MYFDFDDLNEEIRVWMNVHDTKTNKNLIAQMYGTVRARPQVRVAILDASYCIL
jgi:hypothetical protein